MTTDADRITRLEAITEHTASELETIRRGQEALRGEIQNLRAEMQAGDSALRAEMQRGQEGQRGEIQNLRAEMQRGQEGLRTDMASNLRIILVAIFGGVITILVAIVGAFFGLYFA